MPFQKMLPLRSAPLRLASPRLEIERLNYRFVLIYQPRFVKEHQQDPFAVRIQTL